MSTWKFAIRLWMQLLIKKGSFWAFLKNSIDKKNVEHLQTERAKKRYQEINFVKKILKVEVLFLAFGIGSIVMLLWI